ncbi:P-loop containing nucleoside triphosphate hydrolase protein [Microthyrium microscopicum]|uniref:P-loop containing nucleoside triphosphate hydrolase protein n=1 Tax=Microthyrium microscopicum TaxID=703497 RepID=A0A6A6U3S1_9PEZI|nr:P-loop containing nucleoside triphosphate hydrolase protein [Microthyrium microscopicum]
MTNMQLIVGSGLLTPPPEASSSKGTLASRLIETYNLHHLSSGDWLRSQAQPPISGAPGLVNEYVSEGRQIPEPLLIEAWGEDWKAHAPPALELYQEFLRVSGEHKAQAILLDNFPKTITQSDALDDCLTKADSPIIAISLTCYSDINLQRFMSRGRGEDNEATFKRRIERFDQESPAVIEKYRTAGKLVETHALETPDEVYQRVTACTEAEQWNALIQCLTKF